MGIYFTRKYGHITAEERERAISAAKLLKPKKPSFMVIWQSNNLRNSRVVSFKYVFNLILINQHMIYAELPFYLLVQYVPLKFSTRYLRDVSKHVKLQYSDGTKSVAKMIWYDSTCYISKGWTRTTSDRYFKTGDICNFELVSMKDVLFKVSAFSASIE